MINRPTSRSKSKIKQLQKGQRKYMRQANQAAHYDDTPTPVFLPPVRADIIQSAQGDVYKVEDPDYVEPETHKLVTYQVHGDQITDPTF